MTRVRLYTRSGALSRIEVEGHSGYADAGEDVVCAGVTASIRLIECTLNDVLRLDLPVRADAAKAQISIDLSASIPHEKRLAVDALLRGFSLVIEEYQHEYPKHIQLLEVQLHA